MTEIRTVRISIRVSRLVLRYLCDFTTGVRISHWIYPNKREHGVQPVLFAVGDSTFVARLVRRTGYPRRPAFGQCYTHRTVVPRDRTTVTFDRSPGDACDAPSPDVYATTLFDQPKWIFVPSVDLARENLSKLVSSHGNTLRWFLPR